MASKPQDTAGRLASLANLLLAVALGAGAWPLHSAADDVQPPDPLPEFDAPRACGVGTLGFGDPILITPPSRPPIAARLFVDLLNADDPHLDIGIARGNLLHSFLGDGAGGFLPLAPLEVAPRASLLDVATGDIDGDGLNDAILVDARQMRSVLVLSGSADGRLAGGSQRVQLGPARQPRATVAGDLDDDGLGDIAVANRSSRRLSVLLRRPPGTPGPSFVRSTVDLPVAPVQLAMADVDGAGGPDLVVASPHGDLVVVFNQAGDFSSVAPLYIPMHVPTRGVVAGFGAADVNGDGRVDLISLLANGQLAVRLAELAPFPPSDPEAVPAFPSAGEARFGPPIRSRLSCHGGCRYSALALGDVDLDGLRDLVAAGAGASAHIQVFFALGDGRFGLGASLPTSGAAAVDLRLAELNGDRRLDVVVGSRDGSVWVVPTACACRPPFGGPFCEACVGDPSCPNSSRSQLAVGPASIVPIGAQLVARSQTPPGDARRAARFAQQIAALGLEADLVVVAQPRGRRSELFPSHGSPVPFTLTRFDVEQLLVGPAGVESFEIAQEGGAVGDLVVENPNTIPFLDIGDLALCPEASQASTSVHWLLFLTALGSDAAGSPRVRLLGDLTLPALKVDPDGADFVLPDRESGLALPTTAIGDALRDGRAR